MIKSLIFKRAWKSHKIKLKHNCKSRFGDELKRCIKINKLMGTNYKEQPFEFV
jgi:hypothetical protein